MAHRIFKGLILNDKPDHPDAGTSDTPARSFAVNDLGKISRFALRHAADKNLTQVAASLTFTTVLGVVPLLAVVLSLFTAFPLFAEFRVALEDFLASNLMPPSVSANIMTYLNEFASKASGLTAIGSLALIVTSIMLIRTIDDALNNIWQVELRRPLRQRILVYWAIVSLGPVLTGASLWASSIVAQQSLDYINQVPAVITFLLSSVPLVLTGLGFTALFMGVPNCSVYWKDALAGGFITAIALESMRFGFAVYLTRFPSYTVIYGAFATVPIFLLWMYMSWLAILSGATLAATLPALRQRRWNVKHYPGALFVDAVAVLAQLWQTQSNNPPGQTAHALALKVDAHPTELTHVLGTLKDLGYIANSETQDSDIWILACDPRQAKLKPLVEALLIDSRQPALRQNPALLNAVATVLEGDSVLLEVLFERPYTLAEASHVQPNRCKVTEATSTKEVHHAKSQ